MSNSSHTITRRTVLGSAAVAGFGIAFAGSLEAFARPEPGVPGRGYGPLIPDPNGLLSLPAGFSYVLVAQSNVTLTDDINDKTGDAIPYPSDPDGMGVFAWPDGGSVLVTNHENSAAEPAKVPAIAGLTYDPAAIGGPRRCRWTATGSDSAATPALPAPTTTARAASRRGVPG